MMPEPSLAAGACFAIGNAARRTLLARRDFLRLAGAASAGALCPLQAGEPRLHAAEVCVYGGNASGIAAAVADFRTMRERRRLEFQVNETLCRLARLRRIRTEGGI